LSKLYAFMKYQKKTDTLQQNWSFIPTGKEGYRLYI